MDRFLKENQLKNYYEYVFKNSIKSDFEIVLHDKVIKVHKEVLGQQNPVFLDKFISHPQLNKFEIRNFDSNAVGIFINYLYTGKLFDGDVSEELFLVAHKFMDLNLKNTCREKFVKTLAVENAAKRLLFFLDHDEAKLVQEASIFVAKNFNEIKLRCDFKQILEKKEAISAIFNVFGDCKITVLSEDKNADQKSLIDSAMKSDLVVEVQEHSFLGHKKVLSRNKTFKTAISSLSTANTLSLSNEGSNFDLNIFSVFLKYLYSREVDKSEISIELMNVAFTYGDSKLQKVCEEKLVSTVTEENAIELLILSTKVQSEILKEKTSKFIAERYEEMKDRDGFQVVKENPVAVEAIFSQFSVRIDRLYDSFKLQKDTHSYSGVFELSVPFTIGCVYSEPFFMKNIAWRLMAELKANNLTHLGLFLHCDDDGDDFKHEVNSTLKLISSVNKKYDISRGGTVDTYSPDDLDLTWGWTEFVSLADLNDEKKGLMKNGMITVKLSANFVD